MEYVSSARHATPLLLVFLARHLGVVVDAHSCEGGWRLQCMDVHDLENAPASVGGKYAEAHPMCNAEGRRVNCLPHHGHHSCTAVGQAQCCEGELIVPRQYQQTTHSQDPNDRHRRRLPNEQEWQYPNVCRPASPSPSQAPTAFPSQTPTAVPTSAAPTGAPTAVPTDEPTAAPTPWDITKYGKKGVLQVTAQGKFTESMHGDANRNVDDLLDLVEGRRRFEGVSRVFESILEAKFHVQRVEFLDIEVDDAGRRLSDSDSSNRSYSVHFFAYGEPSLGALRRTTIADALQEVFSAANVEVVILSTWLDMDTEMSKRDDIDDNRLYLPRSELDEENDQKQFAARTQLQTDSDKAQGTGSEDFKLDSAFAVSICAAIISALTACLCACCILKCQAAKKGDATNNNDVENNNTEIANAYGKSAEQNANLPENREVAGEILRPASSPSSPASIDIGDASKPKNGQTDDDETNSVSTAAPASDIGGANLERPSWHSDEVASQI